VKERFTISSKIPFPARQLLSMEDAVLNQGNMPNKPSNATSPVKVFKQDFKMLGRATVLT